MVVVIRQRKRGTEGEQMGRRVDSGGRIVVGGVAGATAAEGVLANLRYSVQLLAAPAAEQIAHFLPPDFAAKTDEMALELDHWAQCAPTYWTLTHEQTTRLNALDAYLEALSGMEHAEFWTDAALVSDPRWEEVRTLAVAVLTAFEWPKQTPPPMRYLDDSP
jgi:hypothetical protein